MKRLFYAIVAAAVLASCAPKQPADPFQAALVSEIRAQVGSDAKVAFEMFERVDSTTFGEELTYRRGIFDLRRAQNEKLFKKYKAAGQPNSAAAKRNAINHDDEVIAGLAQMSESLAGILGDVAYYDYHFTCKVKAGNAKAEYRDYYATITPDCKVMSVENSQKTLHKSLGRVIPGYLELVKSEDEVTEENADKQ